MGKEVPRTNKEGSRTGKERPRTGKERPRTSKDGPRNCVRIRPQTGLIEKDGTNIQCGSVPGPSLPICKAPSSPFVGSLLAHLRVFYLPIFEALPSQFGGASQMGKEGPRRGTY